MESVRKHRTLKLQQQKRAETICYPNQIMIQKSFSQKG